MGETFKGTILTVHKDEGKPIEIVGQHRIYSVAFFVDEKHFASDEGKSQRWRTEDSKEVGTGDVNGCER